MDNPPQNPKRLTNEQRNLVEAHLDVAARVARKKPSALDPEDAAQEAALGVIDAATRFDRKKRAAFAGYASYRAYGAIQDAERRDGLIPLKSRRENGVQTHRRMEPRPFRPENSGGIPGENLDAIKRHFDPFFADLEDSDAPSVVDEAIRREWHERFWACVSQFPPRSQAIIRGRVEGRSMQSIAQEIGHVQSRVTQLLPGIIRELGAMMRERESA